MGLKHNSSNSPVSVATSSLLPPKVHATNIPPYHVANSLALEKFVQSLPTAISQRKRRGDIAGSEEDPVLELFK